MVDVVISSGHGKYVAGASGYLIEVEEARRVTDTVAGMLTWAGLEVPTFHDDVSHSVEENLDRIVDFHNSQPEHKLDVSIHFNAYVETADPMGTECLYVSQERLAEQVATAIAKAGKLNDRGPKYRDGLYFLNNTRAPAILVEVCFVDSQADAALYKEHYARICLALAKVIRATVAAPAAA